MRVVFMGTPEFAVPSLQALIDHHQVAGVVTQPDRQRGRGKKVQFSPVKEKAVAYDIPVLQPERARDEAFIEELAKLDPEVIVVVAYGQILPESILNLPKYGCINLHASLLPKYRGANPIQRAIINGETETGICTMVTELGLDTGPICLTQPIEINRNMNCVELFEICSEESPKLLEKTLLGIADGTLTPKAQCENGVCYADKLQKEECKIDWNKSALEIHNLVRGVYKCPGAFFEYNGKIIKVMETEVINTSSTGNIGEFINISKSGIDIQTGKGVLRLLKVKPEGKGEMSARDWSNGLNREK